MTTNTSLPTDEPLRTPSARPAARYLPTIARILLGLVFFVFGLNGFLHFIPQPTTGIPPKLLGFMGGMMQTGYMMPLIFGTQVLAGALLLANRFVPLALALIAPVVVNIFAVHAFLAPDGLVIAVVVAALEIYLAWAYRERFRPMLAMRSVPA